MSYITLEVEIEGGRVLAKEPGQMPQSGRGLLTILSPAPVSGLSQKQAFQVLERSLKLDQHRAAAWQSSVREARR